MNDVGPSGHLPLGEASARGYRRVVEALLAANADVEVTSPARGSATPVAISVIEKQNAITDMLIKVRDGHTNIFQKRNKHRWKPTAEKSLGLTE